MLPKPGSSRQNYCYSPWALLCRANGSEFINQRVWEYCVARDIAFTRGRPYKKDDNAHIEQKNWTQVRKVLGWDRYESAEALGAINDLYRNERRLMNNFFQPSVQLQRKTRVGARRSRRYDAPQTPFDRLSATPGSITVRSSSFAGCGTGLIRSY